MNTTPDPLIEIFNQALALPIEDRGAYLSSACADRAISREQVEHLLLAHDRAGGFLDEPVGFVGTGRAVGEQAGDLVGHYRLVEQIGEGGCGVVFLARQLEPVQREVALKIVKPGMDTRSVIAQFGSERQALAMMEHPHIAQVLDAGATEAGRPYFVMELVRGVKITDYCDQHALGIRARLELFVQVCHAIQHAHQKGIIHRDIKPSNVLVTTTGEGGPLPKVIDFGIAKATTGQQLADRTFYTAFELLIGTPNYMSPEQAALKAVDVDTRTDIYSLGVLLYELLTGALPFEVRDLFKAGLEEVRRDILNNEPVRPSTRLKLMAAEDLDHAARDRGVEALRLIRQVRGDLDWIVMKALEKERARRYPTANALAVDVVRHLANEPVQARPPGTLYQLGKLVARNRLLVGSLAVISVLLLVSLAAVSSYLARERAAHLQAEAEKLVAKAEAEKSRQVTTFLQDMLSGVSPSVAMGRDTSILREILEHTERRVASDLASQPEVAAEVRLALAVMYRELGSYEAAEKMLRPTVEILRGLSPENPRSLATALCRLGQALFYQNKYDEAIRELDASLAIWRSLNEEGGEEAISAIEIVALVRSKQGKVAEAESMIREVHELRLKIFPPEHPEVLNALGNLGNVLFAAKRLDEAEQVYRQLLDTRRKLFGDWHPSVASSWINLGYVLMQQKRMDEARTGLERALEIRRRLLERGHPDRANALLNLGDLERATGRLAEAEVLFRELVRDARQRPDDFNQLVMNGLARLMAVMMAQGRHAEFEALLAELLPPEVVESPRSMLALNLQLEFMARTGRWEDAVAVGERLVVMNPVAHESYHMLAPLQVAAGKEDGYRKTCEQIVNRFAMTTDIAVADRMAKDCLIRPGAVADLAPVARMADLALSKGASHPALPFFQACRALADYRMGRFVEAAELAGEVGDKLPYAQVEALAVQAMALKRLNRDEEAQAVFAKAAGVFETKMPKLESGNLGADWRDWVIARELLREAGTLMAGDENGR